MLRRVRFFETFEKNSVNKKDNLSSHAVILHRGAQRDLKNLSSVLRSKALKKIELLKGTPLVRVPFMKNVIPLPQKLKSYCRKHDSSYYIYICGGSLRIYFRTSANMLEVLGVGTRSEKAQFFVCR